MGKAVQAQKSLFLTSLQENEKDWSSSVYF